MKDALWYTSYKSPSTTRRTNPRSAGQPQLSDYQHIIALPLNPIQSLIQQILPVISISTCLVYC
ncbi:hypothetical protein BDW42DRAFT_180160 [Aspergillus taichungensis]|uniref:Uncharacterized protein n=1 Tax=Aspergillus taichungensis TaxID=482145 RepID=A0A2J5HFP9_9EURO|nr:hypothetical protein BDW42DRAFT_180160 [Aspergillus taichungensis]